MFRYHWTEHHLRICLLSYRIIYVLFKYHNYYCCGEHYTYDAVGVESMQFVTEWIRNIIVFTLSDNASSYSSKFELAKIR